MLSTAILVRFVTCLGLTLAFELPVALLWGLRRRDLLLCTLVNVLTNPVVVLLNLLFPTVWLIPILEAAAVVTEWRIYRLCGDKIPAPFLLALCANACSFGFGLLIGGLPR